MGIARIGGLPRARPVAGIGTMSKLACSSLSSHWLLKACLPALALWSLAPASAGLRFTMGKRGAGSTPRVETKGPRNRPWEPPPRKDSVAGTRAAGRPAAQERSSCSGDSAAMVSGRPQAAAGSRLGPALVGLDGGGFSWWFGFRPHLTATPSSVLADPNSAANLCRRCWRGLTLSIPDEEATSGSD